MKLKEIAQLMTKIHSKPWGFDIETPEGLIGMTLGAEFVPKLVRVAMAAKGLGFIRVGSDCPCLPCKVADALDALEK